MFYLIYKLIFILLVFFNTLINMNIFGCCNSCKDYKKSDIDIKKMNSERENYSRYIHSQINNNQITSLNNYIF